MKYLPDTSDRKPTKIYPGKKKNSSKRCHNREREQWYVLKHK